ncbi:MAG TPA: nuclear transport factor 2 family protein [Acidimicrobiia bacterium]|nr:nuclear transport factor 2 family protein [Acidimicrobiia bacterium]
MTIDVATWADSYARAWVEMDAEAAADLFAEDATYRSFIFDEPQVGRDGVKAYWSEVTATQADVHVTMGRPIVDGSRAAVEFWTTMENSGEEVTLVGCLLLAFDDEGRCRSLDEYYEFAQGLLDPPAGWGAL